jgi:predicted anti-sigma-YlaC factor YlaD
MTVASGDLVSDLDCKEFVELVTAYLDAALDAQTERRVIEHLQLCDGCSLYLDQFRRTIRTLGELPADRPPDTLREALLDVFRSSRG